MCFELNLGAVTGRVYAESHKPNQYILPRRAMLTIGLNESAAGFIHTHRLSRNCALVRGRKYGVLCSSTADLFNFNEMESIIVSAARPSFGYVWEFEGPPGRQKGSQGRLAVRFAR
jgi:hypothetical protein